MSIVVQRVVFNLPTTLAITVFTPTLAGCLLLLSWLQHRTIFALALWGSGFIVAAVATTLIIVARGAIPDFGQSSLEMHSSPWPTEYCGAASAILKASGYPSFKPWQGR